jgi:hypothetical protein
MTTAIRVLAIAALVVGSLVAVRLSDLAGSAFYVAYAAIGAYLVIQRPRNPIGWLLIGVGWGLCIGSLRVELSAETLLSGTLDPTQTFVMWANGCGWSIAFVCFFTLAVVFPTGSLPRGQARWPIRIGLVAMVGLAILMWMGPTLSISLSPSGASVQVPNPTAVAPGSPLWAFYPGADLTYATMFGFLLLSVLALVQRYRRSTGQGRLQYRWLVAAIVLVAVTNFWWALATFVLGFNQYGPAWWTVVVAYLTVPVAVAVAIQRYRLYNIDRIISRSIGYAGATAVLAGVFGATVLLLSTALASLAQAQTIAVAGSTLITYAALQPVLGRVRRAVDRRFDRTRYDAELTVIAFADRLRSETNVEAVTTDLTSTSRAVVAPTSASLWLRPHAADR